MAPLVLVFVANFVCLQTSAHAAPGVLDVLSHAGLDVLNVGNGFLVNSVHTTLVQPSPPVFPARFHISFAESSRSMNPFGPYINNSGSYHYDYASGRQLWSHGKGQVDNWCQCAGLKTDEQCDLHALKLESGGATYAVFKSMSLPTCCKIGDFAHGFGPLRPDWMKLGNATFVGEKQVNGKTCYEWAVAHPGDWITMVSDNWSVDADGQPCTYENIFNTPFHLLGLYHMITFDSATYGTNEESVDVFALPSNLDCEAECPNKHGWCTAR